MRGRISLPGIVALIIARTDLPNAAAPPFIFRRDPRWEKLDELFRESYMSILVRAVRV